MRHVDEPREESRGSQDRYTWEAMGGWARSKGASEGEGEGEGERERVSRERDKEGRGGGCIFGTSSIFFSLARDWN